jgi:hypothetical protein
MIAPQVIAVYEQLRSDKIVGQLIAWFDALPSTERRALRTVIEQFDSLDRTREWGQSSGHPLPKLRDELLWPMLIAGAKIRTDAHISSPFLTQAFHDFWGVVKERWLTDKQWQEFFKRVPAGTHARNESEMLFGPDNQVVHSLEGLVLRHTDCNQYDDEDEDWPEDAELRVITWIQPFDRVEQWWIDPGRSQFKIGDEWLTFDEIAFEIIFLPAVRE